MTWEWQFYWWESSGEALFIILIREQNDLIGILPFIRIRHIFFHTLKLIGSPHSDYLDFIVKKGCEKKVLDYFFSEYLKKNRKIGIIELDAINERSPHIQILLNELPPSVFKFQKSEKTCPYITLPASWEAYLKSLSPSMRYFINRKERRIAKNFKAKFGIVKNECELQARMEDFIEQHQKRWNQRDFPGAFQPGAFRQFHNKIAACLFEKGYLKLYYLELDQKPVASFYLFQYNTAVLYYLSGFDPAYAGYSPGLVLMGRVIRDAIENGINEFDFMRGSSDYKFKWTREKRTNISFSLGRKHMAVIAYVLFAFVLKRIALFIKEKTPPRSKEKIRGMLPDYIVQTFDPFFRD